MENSNPHGHVNDHSHSGHASKIHADHAGTPDDQTETAAHETGEAEPAPSNRDTLVTTAVTVGVVGVAAVVFEAALIPGMILGVAAALAPSYVPRLGAALNPLFRSTIRGAYKFGQKTREAASEVREQMSDIAAEVHAEGAAIEKAKPATL